MSFLKLCTAWLLCLSPILKAATLPVGTELQVRLMSEVSSQKPSGQPVSGLVTVPVFLGGVPVLSSGAILTGVTADVVPFTPATTESAAKPAALRLQFTGIHAEAGRTASISCIVESVDNARESVDSTGLINGIDASKTYEAQLNKAISKLESHSSGLAQLLSGVESAFVKDVDADIDYKPGVDMTLKLTEPLNWTAPASIRTPGLILPASAVLTLANSEPFRTVAQSPPEPSDITNVMLIGTAEQIQAAFHSAGWFPAAALSRSSKAETARALIEDRGYSEAPMSILYLEGRPPDLALQKQNNTFAMRHHIRLWQMPQTFNGKPVWVAAATHDIKITFSPASRSFTHGIDTNIDLERAKVVNDLLFTGMVRGLSLVERAGIPKNASNATGDPLTTDGQMAVLEFQ